VGAPNLSDRFIVGAGGGYQPHTNGEADTHTHVIPALSAYAETSVAGAHQHALPSKWFGQRFFPGWNTSIDTNGDYGGDWVQSAGDHRHGVVVSFPSFYSAANSGGIRPRWYALCYIMKKAWQ
jgi:outer membrane scaffolding protein for murein synthesis (MipA/OmpV family)